ncbi:hypothetical protein [Tsuneonella dongtanensis]|uniref:hypothetical protein n=1 Tax=Tsuneonella dongtanensis TaxID=692370 RepID=UPI00082C0C54|nr:hypothetical protein [Tsuneonella dongtanensis]
MRSHYSCSVQHCDILAKLLAKERPDLVGGTLDSFIAEVDVAGAAALNYSGVMQQALYVDGPPQRRNGPDMVDRKTELLWPHLDKKKEGLKDSEAQ